MLVSIVAVAAVVPWAIHEPGQLRIGCKTSSTGCCSLAAIANPCNCHSQMHLDSCCCPPRSIHEPVVAATWTWRPLAMFVDSATYARAQVRVRTWACCIWLVELDIETRGQQNWPSRNGFQFSLVPLLFAILGRRRRSRFFWHGPKRFSRLLCKRFNKIPMKFSLLFANCANIQVPSFKFFSRSYLLFTFGRLA